jgi:hypothetical protein
MSETDPVRIALLVDGDSISKWQYQAVKRTLQETDAEISVVIRNQADQSRSKLELLQRAIELREWTVVTLIRKLILQSSELTGEVKLNECEFVSDADYIDCVPNTVDGWKNTLPEETVEQVAGRADVGVLFGFGVLIGEILNVFKYGILSYHHGDFREYRGQPAGCWEFIHEKDEVGITLQRINNQLDAGKVAVEKKVSIEDVETYAEIRNQLYRNSDDMLSTAVSGIEMGVMEFETVNELGPLYTFPKGVNAWQFLLKEVQGNI